MTADLLVWVAYMAIPAALVYFVRRRTDLPFRGVFWLFIAFILSCGLTHLLDALTFISPQYRLTGLAKLITAGISLVTVVRLAPILPQLLSLRSPRELEREIAERQRTEQGLRESEERFRTLVESAPDAIILSDAAGTIVGWNGGAERMFGHPAAAAVGRPMTLIIPERFRAAHTRGMERLRATGEARVIGRTVELSGLRADGAEFPLELALARWESGQGEFYCGIIRDTSERKRQEAALALAEARFRSMFENATEGIFQTTPAGHYLNANPALARTYGYPSPEHLRADVLDIARQLYVDPARRAEFVARMERDGRVEDFESQVRRSDGTVIWIRENARAVCGADGALHYFEGTVRDVTAQKAAEAALHATDRRLRAQNRVLTDLAARLPAEVDDERAYLRALTEAAAGCLGVTRASVWQYDPDRTHLRCVALYEPTPGRHATWAALGAAAFPAYFAALEGERVVAAADALADPRTAPFADDYLRPLGIGALLDAPIRLGGRTVGVLCCEHVGGPRAWEADEQQFAASAADVAALALAARERRRAEDRLREQAALLDEATDAIFALDRAGRIAYWNRSAERLYGWTAAEAVGQVPDDLLLAPAGDLDAARAAVAATGAWSGELTERTKAGDEVVVESRWTQVHDAAGAIKSQLVVNTDVTQKKRLEGQFLRAQRLESLGTLAGGIAHDLNNVLTPIVMATELLRLRCPDPQSRMFLETLEANAQRGAEMVRQILSFARGADAGKRQPLMLAAVVADLDKMLRRTLPKSIAVTAALPPDLWLVQADGTQLYQVLMNLCVNARDAMPHGGALALSAANLTLDADYARLHLEARTGRYVQLTVTDTGGGMPADVRERIFEPFYTTKELGKGTGLGLATVLGIVKSHGGFINVYSEPGRGTEFKVYLPAADLGTSPDARPAAPAAPAGAGRVVLLIDDEAAIRQVASGTLEAYGYRVLAAQDGIEALALYRRHASEIDVVLTDMMMPGMDGPATIRALRELEPRLRIIAASGLAAHAHANGVQAFLPKPYTADSLLRALQDVCAPAGAARTPPPGVN